MQVFSFGPDLCVHRGGAAKEMGAVRGGNKGQLSPGCKVKETKPIQAKPIQSKPSQAKPSQAKQSWLYGQNAVFAKAGKGSVKGIGCIGSLGDGLGLVISLDRKGDDRRQCIAQGAGGCVFKGGNSAGGIGSGHVQP